MSKVKAIKVLPPVAAIILVIATLALIAARAPDPPFTFLKGRKPSIVDAQRDPTTGASRRVLVYRVSESYQELATKYASEVEVKAKWRLEQKGTGPNWREYYGPNESIEFVDDEPTDFEAKALGVSWTPTGVAKPKYRTIFYTCPGSRVDALIAPVRSFFRSLRRP